MMKLGTLKLISSSNAQTLKKAREKLDLIKSGIKVQRIRDKLADIKKQQQTEFALIQQKQREIIAIESNYAGSLTTLKQEQEVKTKALRTQRYITESVKTTIQELRDTITSLTQPREAQAIAFEKLRTTIELLEQLEIVLKRFSQMVELVNKTKKKLLVILPQAAPNPPVPRKQKQAQPASVGVGAKAVKTPRSSSVPPPAEKRVTGAPGKKKK